MNGARVQNSSKQHVSFSLLWKAAARQKAYLILFASFILGMEIALAIYGWDYYTLGLPLRPFSPKHDYLKPSGTIGMRLGMLGLVLLMMVYLYPLRKYWPTLGRIGKTKNWFNFHVLLGLLSPTVITFHSSFKYKGFAGMAYWTMIALVISGIIGRYFYAQIPRSINAAELSLKEMQDLQSSLLEELKRLKIFQPSDIESLFRLPDSKDIHAMSAYHAVIKMMALDLIRPFKVWSLRRRQAKLRGYASFGGGILSSGNNELENAVRLASKQAALSKHILFLSKTHKAFHGWHVIHRPFSISVAIFVLIHVAVVTWLGYY